MTSAPRRPTLAGARRWAAALSWGDWGPESRRRRYLPVIAVVALSLVVVAGLALVPIRTYWSQRQQQRDAESELRQLQGEVAQLDARLQELRTDAEVERIAREHYDLVFPGEESFRILPAPEPEPAPSPDRDEEASEGADAP